jgi:hypothetical protein
MGPSPVSAQTELCVEGTLVLIVPEGFGRRDNDPEELPRKVFLTMIVQPVPQTDTVSQVENTKVLE